MGTSDSVAWRPRLGAVGVGLSAWTSGVMASMSLVTSPAILHNTTNASLLACWRTSLKKGVKVGPTCGFVATLVHLANAYASRDNPSYRASALSIAAATSTAAIVPFTFTVLAPTNKELFARDQAALGTSTPFEQSTVDLVKKWGRLNFTRSMLPAIGAVIACFAIE